MRAFDPFTWHETFNPNRKMNQLLALLSGKKTYLTAVTVGVLLFGQWQGWWKIDPNVYTALTVVAIAFLRAGVSKGPADATDGPSAPPPTGNAGGTGTPAAKIGLPLMLAFVVVIFLLIPVLGSGCAHLQPGADPLVVNAERTETVAESTFTLVLDADNTDRGYWRTNAPAFHNFCEWLRQPQTVEDSYGTNTLPRALAMVLMLDDIKLDYQASKASSNAVLEAITTLESATSQALSWSNVLTNPKAP